MDCHAVFTDYLIYRISVGVNGDDGDYLSVKRSRVGVSDGFRRSSVWAVGVVEFAGGGSGCPLVLKSGGRIGTDGERVGKRLSGNGVKNAILGVGVRDAERVAGRAGCFRDDNLSSACAGIFGVMVAFLDGGDGNGYLSR